MARYPMKRERQTVDEMAAEMIEFKNTHGSRSMAMYPEASAEVKRQALASIVDQQRELLKKTRTRGHGINLDSLEEVSQCADDYLQACVKANVFPTMLGFSAATGWSRPWIYRYIQTHNTESARFLDNLRSSWAAILAQMALSRNASEPVSIFLLKNSGQDLTDRTEITAIPMTPMEQELSLDDISRRYLDITDEARGTGDDDGD